MTQQTPGQLQIPDQLGLSETEQVQIHQQWSTFEKVQQQLRNEGFIPLGTPPYACPGYIDLETITSHNSQVLTTMMAQCKAWRDYAAQRGVFSRQILVETRNELKDIETKTKAQMRAAAKTAKPIPAGDVKEAAAATPRYAQLLLQEQEHIQSEEYYTSEASRFASNFQLLSRAITIRGQDIEQGNRAGNVGAHGTGQQPPPYG